MGAGWGPGMRRGDTCTAMSSLKLVSIFVLRACREFEKLAHCMPARLSISLGLIGLDCRKLSTGAESHGQRCRV